ncbi:5,10-methenyltetrahydrofolate synthetase [Mesorhizobium sp. J18]|nr:5,10-methenyltetrahydrofolate synthetase [Mesorhizobium sp. J18]
MEEAMNQDKPSAQYASPPCFMHELDGHPEAVTADVAQWNDIARWRKAERQRLIEARLAVSADDRAAMTQGIVASLDQAIGDPAGRMVSIYWPFRGEPDLRSWLASINERGGRTALPLVVKKGRPLIFRSYRTGDPLERSVWNIPVPATGEEVVPDVVIAPVVGFDARCYRLGYGGGFFDRTLAALPRKPLTIGIGYGIARIPTIYPQPHDIPMDVIITDAGIQD